MTGRDSFQDLKQILPLFPLTSTVAFPLGVTSIEVGNRKNLELLSTFDGTEWVSILAFASALDSNRVETTDIAPIGVTARIISRLDLPDNAVQATFHGLHRVGITEVVQHQPFFTARLAPVEEAQGNDLRTNALIGDILTLLDQLVSLDNRYSKELIQVLRMNVKDPGRFADLVAINALIPLEQKQRILEAADVAARLETVAGMIESEMQRLRVVQEVDEKVSVQVKQAQKEFFLKQQMATIREELGEEDEEERETEALRAQIAEAELPAPVRTEAERELRRLSRTPPASPEHTVIRTYLDWVLALPWRRAAREEVDVARVEATLEEAHYGLGDVKDRVLEYLAVRTLNPDQAGPILCFAGPPGTGKTSMGAAIARALGRPFHRISVGGVRDEAEIRGHRRTYVGAMPGKILQGIRRAGACNPLLVIDEIEKMGKDRHGDPTAAMLEVLDPEQHHQFEDHYLGVPFDLSPVMFITTANHVDAIPGPLRDRMEVIPFRGYSPWEKTAITRRHLLPRAVREAGLPAGDFHLSAAALDRLVGAYTREAGVRNLSRQLAKLCRRAAREKVTGKRARWRFTPRKLEAYLGPPPYKPETGTREPRVGVVHGLGVTPTGGEVLMIEALQYPGEGKVVTTGHLGAVMEESVQAALSFVKSRTRELGITPAALREIDLHVHFPSGAIPEDGPSAGIACAAAIASLLSGKPVRADLAMTGEITLRGAVLPVGGITEKVLAAHRAGLPHALLPEGNRSEAAVLDPRLRRGMKLTFVQDLAAVLREALMDIYLPEQEMTAAMEPGAPSA